MADLRVEHAEALLALIHAWSRTTGASDDGSYGRLADALLAAGWRPAYDGEIEVTEDSAGEFRWRAVARNGQPVAGPQEGYANREHAELMATKVTGIYV